MDDAREKDRETDDAVGHAPEPERTADVPAEDEASHEVMSLLSEHVPLALLADLALPDGPASPEILDEEGLPEVAWWEAGAEGDDSETEDAKRTV